MKQILLLSFLLTTSLYSQFDSLLFEKHLSPYKYGVVALGDQNSDGFDDILIYDCKESKALIFFGGNPMDTIPDWEKTIIQRSIVAMDANGDSVKDIIIAYQDTMDSNQKGKVNIYFGGSLLDTIPDIHFEAPEWIGKNFGLMYVLEDFDGDSKSELMIYDADYPFDDIRQYGIFYIFKTNPVLDTIPFIIIKGDTLNDRRLGPTVTVGDIDGDGLTDMGIEGSKGNFMDPFLNFYKGNADRNTEPFITYYQSEHVFDPTRMKIVEDINGDKRDDILIKSYGSFYPYYYLNSFLYGSIPIDTIPDIGLNTQNEFIFDAISPGDLNKDGYNDFLASVSLGFNRQGKLWVGGNPMPDLRQQFWGGNDNGYGELIGKVGDVNGDGLADICVGQSGSQSICYSGFVQIFAGDTLFQQPVGIEEEKNFLSEGFYFNNPYPNPFNPVTVISYQLPVNSNISIKVYDILGREIKELVNGEQPSGKHQLKFDGSNLSSGVYFIKLTATSKGTKYSSTKKILLVK